VSGTDGPASGLDALGRSRVRREIAIVLGLSLGASGVLSFVQLLENLTAPGGLSNQTATLVASYSPRSLFDLTYQLLYIAIDLVPVLLAVHLLSASPDGAPGLLRTGWDRIGMGLRSRHDVGSNAAWGVLIAVCIGLPGLGLVYLARDLGINASIVPDALNSHWWTIPVLVLSALENALLEEVVVVGFLVTRLRELGRPAPVAVAISAVVRGSYHLYQGFGGFLGNAVMGLIFGTWFVKRRSVLSLFVAHAIMDSVAFVGYALLKNRLDLP
jgi:membrane protease YdiL (CAAX protease family)